MYTLAEGQKNAVDEGNVMKATIIELFRKSELLDIMGFVDIPGNSYSYNLEADAPAIAFRGVNESYTTSTGVINPQTEALRIAGGMIQLDRAQMKMLGEGVWARQVDMKTRALAREIGRKMIKGDTTSNPREFDGLQVRVPVTSTGSQHVANSSSSGGAALSLSKLDDAINTVMDPTHIIMPRAMRPKWAKVQRSSTIAGNVNLDRENFGRPVMTYNDIPIVFADMPGKQTAALPFTETPAGGGTAQCSSAYILSVRESGVHGIQNGGMEVYDMGLVQEGVNRALQIEWLIALVVEDPYAICRLSSFTLADIAA
ncbi:MAG: hypothetical protein HXY25_06970 [Alphaproteobacteria bacterium]|nr:hypothetical protein [Alphaproteobacteria bacterium]